jgi:hypothetical protein
VAPGHLLLLARGRFPRRRLAPATHPVVVHEEGATTGNDGLALLHLVDRLASVRLLALLLLLLLLVFLSPVVLRVPLNSLFVRLASLVLLHPSHLDVAHSVLVRSRRLQHVVLVVLPPPHCLERVAASRQRTPLVFF